MKKCYLSGAIAHYDIDERRAAFKVASVTVKGMGMKPVNPFDNGLPQSADWPKHMRVDMGMLLQCDYIYMLDGWWLSKEAKLELDVASSCGITPIFQTECNQLNEERL